MADVTVVGQGIFLRGSIRGEGDLDIRAGSRATSRWPVK